MESGKKFCPAMWLSGFFAAPVVVHANRLIQKMDVVVDGRTIPMSWSTIIVVVGAISSIGLLLLSCKKPCCKKEGNR